MTHTYTQALKQPTLHYLTRSVRRASGYVLTRVPPKWIFKLPAAVTGEVKFLVSDYATQDLTPTVVAWLERFATIRGRL